MILLSSLVALLNTNALAAFVTNANWLVRLFVADWRTHLIDAHRPLHPWRRFHVACVSSPQITHVLVAADHNLLFCADCEHTLELRRDRPVDREAGAMARS